MSKLHRQVVELLGVLFPGNTLMLEYSYYRFVKDRQDPVLRAVAKRLHADIYDATLGIIYEIQGIQHYRPIEFFGGDKAFYSQKIRDKYKEQIVMESGKKLVLIPYDFEVSKNNLLELINV